MQQQCKRIVNGILLLNKSSGVTSNFVLQRIKKIFNAQKAGHGGCLDPLATGMLVIAFGRATKCLQYALDSNKEYIVEAKLGSQTNTGDRDGQITKTDLDFINGNKVINKNCLLELLKKFTGSIEQIPPMYSAIKKNGQPLYKLARQGVEIELAARTIQIHALNLIDISASSFVLRVSCSKGTYIRTLVEDLALSLGTYGHVSELHRTKSGHFTAADMLTLDQIEQLASSDPSFAAIDAKLLSIDSVIHKTEFS